MAESFRDRKRQRTRRAIADAGLELIARDGYGATTIAGIAEAADVSPRTVFRYFADKEELVFADDEEHVAAIVASVERAPAGTPALDVVRLAGHAFAAALEERRKPLPTWLRVVASEAPLQARSLTKQRRWEALIAEALEARGDVDSGQARLAAKVGVACVQSALEAWSVDPSRPLAPHVDAAFAGLAELL